jgi:hypothetical protein
LGTYEIPRNVKGEGRILFIFSMQALIYTAVFGGVGLVFYFTFNLIGLKMIGVIITLVFALVGYIIGTFPMPEIPALKFTKQIGGQGIDVIIKRAIKFYSKKSKIYVYTGSEKEKIEEPTTKEEK